MFGRALCLAMLVSQLAWAVDPGDGPTRARASLSAGVAFRSLGENDGVVPVRFGGFSPTSISASGAYFFNRWVGIDVVLNAGFFTVRGSDLLGREVVARTGSFQFAPSAALRWAPKGWLGLELHLGWDVTSWPGLDARTFDVTSASLFRTGPLFGLHVDLAPASLVQAQAYVRASPFAVASNFLDGAMPSGWVEGGFQLGFGRVPVGSAYGAVVLDYNLLGGRGGRQNFDYGYLEHRFTIGVRTRWLMPRVVDPRSPDARRGSVRGVVLVGETPLVGAKVVLGQQPQVETDENGAFSFDDVPAGATTISASREGYRGDKQDVLVPNASSLELTLRLSRPTGPGSIKGSVRGKEPDVAIDGAEVSVGGKVAATTGKDGRFKVSSVGPGPVTVTVKRKGFKTAEEVVQVAPEADASVTLLLVKEGDRPPATLRGMIRSATGRPVRATVRVVETRAKVTVKGDGRFVMQVPGGTYTLVIEAPGFVSQNKVVEVADGDQAIFHVDLQPGSR